MDVEMASGMAPNATIDFYETTNSAHLGPDTMSALNQAGSDNNNNWQISSSWGVLPCENGVTSSLISQAEGIFLSNSATGHNYFFSSGDAGWLCNDQSGNVWYKWPYGANYPATSPWVTSVGGTAFNGFPSEMGWIQALAISGSNGGSSGGGLSALFQRPQWQFGPGVAEPRLPSQYYPTCSPRPCRDFPDVAADADNSNKHTAAYVCWQNGTGSQCGEGGGTSQAAPIWAGILADINQYLLSQGRPIAGFIDPALYSLATENAGGYLSYPFLHDITYGPNTWGFQAGPNWDAATGLGTPDAWGLARNLASCVCSSPAPKDIAAVSSGAGRLDVVARGRDNSLWHNWYDSGGWHGYESLGGNWTSHPAAVSWYPGHLDVFVRGTDNALWHKYYVNGQWYGPFSLGGSLASDPSAVSWANGRIDVFARGSDNTLIHNWFDGQWHTFESLGGSLGSATAPSAISWGPGHLDVFFVGSDNSLWHKYMVNYQWNGPYSLPSSLAVGSGASAVSWGSGRIDVFVRGSDNGLYWTYFDGNWHGFQLVGGANLNSDPSAVSWGQGRLDVFVRCISSQLCHAWYDGTGWHNFEYPNSGPQWTSAPSATAGVWNGQGRVDVFLRGTDYALYHNWNDGAWHGYQSLGGILAN